MDDSKALALYDESVRMLAECFNIEQAVELRNQSAALEEYHRKKDKTGKMARIAKELNLLVERRLGEILKKREMAKGGEQYHKESTANQEGAVPTLKEIGISHKDSSNAKTLAELPEKEFEKVKKGEKPKTQAIKEHREKKREKKNMNSFYITLSDWEENCHPDLLLCPMESTATFNRTNDNIEWAWWTWNPVSGCKMGCLYCYARDIANRFYQQDFEPSFYPGRLSAPFNTKKPESDEIGAKNVFLCSMADLWGDWVPADWIEKILDVVRGAPQWNFLALTKNPERYLEFIEKMPKNIWLGATADTQERLDCAVNVFKEDALIYSDNVKFVSCEPFLEPIGFLPYEDADSASDAPKSMACFVDWIIIGGQSKNSKEPAFQPKWEWVYHLMKQGYDEGCKIYFKPNLTVVPKEYPTK